MIKNFYEYLKNKNENIKIKIHKRKYKLKNLKQHGGTPVDDLTAQVARLGQLRDFITKQTFIVNKLDYERVIGEIDATMASLETLVSKQISDTPDKLELLKNQLTLIKSSIENPDGVFNIRLEQLPNVIVAPPITEEFKFQFQEILSAKEKEMEIIVAKLEGRGDDDDLFKKATGQITGYVTDARQKLEQLERFNRIIQMKIDEIVRYQDSKLEFHLPQEFYIDPKNMVNDSLMIEKLEGIVHLEPDRSPSEIGAQLTKFQIESINPEQLVLPNFSDEKIFSGGSLYLFDINDNKIENVINVIFERWIASINEEIKLLEAKKRETEELIRTRNEEQFRANEEILAEIVRNLNDGIERIKVSLHRKKQLFDSGECNFEVLKIENDKFIDGVDERLSLMQKKLINIMELRNYEMISKTLKTTELTLEEIKSQIIMYLGVLKKRIKDIKQGYSDDDKRLEREIIDKYNQMINYIFSDKTLYLFLMLIYNETKPINMRTIFSNQDSNRSLFKLDSIENIERLKNISSDDPLLLKKESVELITKYNLKGKTSKQQAEIDKYYADLEALQIKSEKIRQCGKLSSKYLRDDKIFQIGGSRKEYNDQLILLQEHIIKYKILYNDFIKNINSFNLLYIDMYHHQLFISSYIDLVLIKRNITIYKYISRGIVEYYLKGIRQITSSFNTHGHSIIDYFKKNHHISLIILEKFLDKIFKEWQSYQTSEPSTENEEMRKNKSKLMLIHETTYNPEINNYKFCVFLFNMYKKIIDDYLSIYNPPVAVFLRINDYVKSGNPKLEYFKKSDKDYFLDHARLTQCQTRQPDELIPYSNKIKDMKFYNIFDPENFNSNEVLALYMSIPTFLENEKSILILTYGYSGVGKTFTVFGKEGNPGLLQISLTKIQNKKSIKVKTFEIYGIALPYTSYWQGKSPEDYNHSIYHYKYSTGRVSESQIRKNDMKSYLDEIKNPYEYEYKDNYDEINDGDIYSFSNFIGNIDVIRKETGRIKKTINNPESSRSIMVYEFKILLESGNSVSFIVMDLPGKEDVKNTYVYNNLQNNPSIESSPEDSRYYSTYGIQIKEKYRSSVDEKALRAAIFLNPMFISLFSTLAKDFINYFKKNILNYMTNEDDKRKYDEFDVLIFNKPELKLVTLLRTNIFSSSSRGTNLVYEDEELPLAISTEIFRYILISNKLDILINFYNEEVFQFSSTNQSKNYGAVALEAFYINENILGLIDVLKSRLGDTSPKTNQMEKYFEKNVRMDKYIQDNKEYTEKTLPTEATQQTYFLRKLIKSSINHINLRNYESEFTPLILADQQISATQTLKSWVEESYDFNKTFTGDGQDPPIRTFMNAYFDKKILEVDGVKQEKDMFDKIFLFLVVNNDGTICSEQIKFISDSKDFVDILNKGLHK